MIPKALYASHTLETWHYSGVEELSSKHSVAAPPPPGPIFVLGLRLRTVQYFIKDRTVVNLPCMLGMGGLLHYIVFLLFPVPWGGFKDGSDDIDGHQLEVGRTSAKESGQ